MGHRGLFESTGAVAMLWAVESPAGDVVEAVVEARGRAFRARVAGALPFGLSDVRRVPYTVTLVTALALAVAVRASSVLEHDFPLNDGGLFYTMVRDLQASGYRLPAETSYNGEGLPFAYPPLAFYVAGVLDDLTPLSLMTLFRLLPLVFTAGTVGAFLLLARSMLGTRLAVLAAVVCFALIPRSFIWLVMGGGLTRALGMLFAVLALRQAYVMYRQRTWEQVPVVALLSAATVLSHLQTGWFLAFSAGLFFLAYGRHRQGTLMSGVIGLGVVALTAPWWGVVLGEHGLEPLRAASGTGGNVFSPGMTEGLLLAAANLSTTSEPWYPLLAGLALMGAVVCVARGELLLPAWWVAIILLDARAYSTYAAVPVGLLGGIGVVEVVVPALARVRGVAVSGGDGWLGEARGVGWAGGGVLAGMLLFGVAGAFAEEPGQGERWILDALTPGEREAMGWIAQNTPGDARFLVVPTDPWERGRESEWFPVLTRRQSVATVQGTEWLPAGAFDSSIVAYNWAWACSGNNSICLEYWVEETGEAFTHVWLPAPGGVTCCGVLRESLEESYRYTLVYEGPGGMVFERRTAFSGP